VHDGHGTYVTASESPLLTKEVIKANVLVGEPDEIAERLKDIAASGSRITF